MLVGVPLGGLLALRHFRGRRFVVTAVNTGMAAPPVVVGLLVALFLTRSGPFGDLSLLYTNWAMVIAQVVIALPIVIGLSLAALQQLEDGFRQQIEALGAGRFQAFLLQLREIRVALLATVMAAFGAVISEVGAVMMVGGNIRGQTQVLTGAIVQETRSPVRERDRPGDRADAAGLRDESGADVHPAAREAARVSASATSDRPLLEARYLRVVRGGRVLAAADDLRLAGGRVHVLLGANGAGKSTLLRALNGLEAADGELRFVGRPVVTAADRLALRRRTAAVFQKAYLLDTTVQGNVESGLRLRGVGRAAARRRAGEALELPTSPVCETGGRRICRAVRRSA